MNRPSHLRQLARIFGQPATEPAVITDLTGTRDREREAGASDSEWCAPASPKGTMTVTGPGGESDPIPYDAGGEQLAAAFNQAGFNDVEVWGDNDWLAVPLLWRFPTWAPRARPFDRDVDS